MARTICLRSFARASLFFAWFRLTWFTFTMDAYFCSMADSSSAASASFLNRRFGVIPVATFHRVVGAAHSRHIFQADLSCPDIFENGQRPFPYQRRPRNRLQHPQVSPLHPASQVDLRLLGQQTYRPHLPKVYPYRVIGMVGCFFSDFLSFGLRIVDLWASASRKSRPCTQRQGVRRIRENIFVNCCI